jgi:SAM-dependent methyltransferase
MSIVGYVEAWSKHFVSGWCFKQLDDRPVRLDIIYNDHLIGTTFAAHHRNDIGLIHSVYQAGFYFSIPPIVDKMQDGLLRVIANGSDALAFVPGAFKREFVFGQTHTGDGLSLWQRIDFQTNTDPQLTLSKIQSEQAGLQANELHTDAVVKQNKGRYFPFKKHLRNKSAKAEFERLAPWMYHIAVGDCSTSDFPHTYTDGSEHMNNLRSELITGTISELYQSRIQNMTVLDIGCNCGVFSFDVAGLGAKKVVGIDVVRRNVDQAKLLRELLQFENVEFHQANLKDLAPEKFDIVLNLGVMHHLSTPYETMSLCHAIAREICIVDTICHKECFSGFFATYKPRKEWGIDGDTIFELQPTYRAIVDLINLVGFRKIQEIISSDAVNMDLYKDLIRRCLCCFK